ncbi:MAG: chromosome partitioning protein [Chromatiaceae bacterium]|nr:MAG: chromosome partitioning protein [Chromatiaceae bacterium]
MPAPRRLVFWHQKGGTGKTTLAIATAVALARAGARVMLLDTDPQGTATAWGERWAEHWGLAVRAHDGAGLWQGVERLGARFDWIIVDCPPLIAANTLEAVAGAQHLLLPVRPALPDLWALEAVAQVLADQAAIAAGAALHARVVFNQTRDEELAPLRQLVLDLGLRALDAPIPAAAAWADLFAGAPPPPTLAPLLAALG